VNGNIWAVSDVITAARMNHKTVLVAAAEPAVMYAGMLWYDTATDLLKERNAANDAWRVIGPAKQGTISSRPAFGNAGLLYYATDTSDLWFDTGAAWEQWLASVALKAGDYPTAYVGISAAATGRAAKLDEVTAARLAELDAANIPTDIDGIKAKTVNLPASPANEATFTHATYGLDKIKTETAAIKAKTDLIAGATLVAADIAVPTADSTADVSVRDVVGRKTDTSNTTVGTTSSLMRYVKGILSRMDAAITTRQADWGAIAGTKTNIDGTKTDTTAIKAKTDLIGASVALEAGGNIATVVGYHAVPTADATTDVVIRDIVGRKTDTSNTTVGTTSSLMRYVKGILNQIATLITMGTKPAADSTNNVYPADVIGSKDDAVQQTVAANRSLMAYIKALLTNMTSTRAGYLDAAITTRLASASYTAERGTDNAMLATNYVTERGTDGAALASSWTAGLATALGSYTAARAAYLDNVNQAGLLQLTAARAALLDQITAARLAELDAANLPTDVDGIKAKTVNLPASPANEATFTHATYGLDKIKTETAAIKAKTDTIVTERGTDNAMLATNYVTERGTDGAALASSWTAGLATALGSYTAARAAYLDNVGKSSLVSVDAAVLLNNDAEVTSTSLSYEKKKENSITVPGQYTIKFDLKRGYTGYDAYGRIYINGVAVGTIRVAPGDTYTTFSEDLFVAANDKVQLWLRIDSSPGISAARNFRMCGIIGFGVGVAIL
jgi:hypothetical protein